LIKASNFLCSSSPEVAAAKREILSTSEKFPSDPRQLPRRPSHVVVDSVGGRLVDSVKQDTGGQVTIQVCVPCHLVGLDKRPAFSPPLPRMDIQQHCKFSNWQVTRHARHVSPGAIIVIYWYVCIMMFWPPDEDVGHNTADKNIDV